MTLDSWSGKDYKFMKINKIEYDPQAQDRPIYFWTIAIYGFERHLFDENGQRRSSPPATSPTGSLSLSLSPFHCPLFIFFLSHSIFLYWVFLLSMDLSDKQQQQQQLSLAKCARQRCNEWFVLCFFFFLLS